MKKPERVMAGLDPATSFQKIRGSGPRMTMVNT
jgi:hypothetical protein